MQRELRSAGQDKDTDFITVWVSDDELDVSGAPTRYRVAGPPRLERSEAGGYEPSPSWQLELPFQTEPGVPDGITDGTLLAILEDRLLSRQVQCSRREVAIALTKLQEAAMWLKAASATRSAPRAVDLAESEAVIAADAER